MGKRVWALEKFKARKGHCHVPQSHLEGLFKLGQWAKVQRLSKDIIAANRKRRLDAKQEVSGWLGKADAAGMIAYLKTLLEHSPQQNTVRPMVAIRERAQVVAMPRGFEEKTDSKLQMRS